MRGVATYFEEIALEQQYIPGYQPTSHPSSIFEATPCRGQQQFPFPSIILCSNWNRTEMEDAGEDTWPGWSAKCQVCTKLVPCVINCQCGLGQHDHCASFAVFAVAHSIQACRVLRVCRHCAGRLLPNTVITIRQDVGSWGEVFGAYNLGGDLLCSFLKEQLPLTYVEMCNMLLANFPEEHNPEQLRFATDGYAYTHDEFLQYYTTHAGPMWGRAWFTTHQIKVLWEGQLLDSESFCTVFHRDVTPPPLPRCLHLLPWLEKFIPYQCWPHEPLCCTVDTNACSHQWVQFAPWGPSHPSPSLIFQRLHAITWCMTYNTCSGVFLTGHLGHEFWFTDLTGNFRRHAHHRPADRLRITTAILLRYDILCARFQAFEKARWLCSTRDSDTPHFRLIHLNPALT